MSKEPELSHIGKVSKGGSLSFEHLNWWIMALDSFREKEVEITIRERKRKKTIPQLALYFGVIIRIHCMEDEQFGGWTLDEIDQYLRRKITGYIQTVILKDGESFTIQVSDDIRKYNVTQMKEYIEKVLDLLVKDHDIEIEDPSIFKLNKYLKEEE